MNTRTHICCLGCLWKKRILQPVKSPSSASPVLTLSLPVTSRQIAEATRKDPVMSKVLSHTLNGWPAKNSDRDVQPYFNRRTELSRRRRSPALGSTRRGTSRFPRQAAWGATRTASRHLQNESPCSQLCLVAQHRHGHWSIKGNISSWPSTPTPSGQRSSPLWGLASSRRLWCLVPSRLWCLARALSVATLDHG